MSSEPAESTDGFIRRALRGARTKSGLPHPWVFELRQGETALSLYDGRRSTPQDVCHAYEVRSGKSGAGALLLHDSTLDQSFEVEEDPTEEIIVGVAHVAARPRRLDADGQIPLEVRETLCLEATWLIIPGP